MLPLLESCCTHKACHVLGERKEEEKGSFTDAAAYVFLCWEESTKLLFFCYILEGLRGHCCTFYSALKFSLSLLHETYLICSVMTHELFPKLPNAIRV